ncbi:MAG: radical SAM protein, partial [Lachnospiraceae bacterium]|nr:radical SAM protein [Lachnospiraceae bacterium]
VNQRGLLGFLEKVKERYPQKSIWCYTGYLYDTELAEGGRAHCECTDRMLELIDVLVDGRFVEAEKDIRLKFRGSANQRIIDVRKSRECGEVVLYELK